MMRGSYFETSLEAGVFFGETTRLIDYRDSNGGFRALVMIPSI